LKVLHYGKELVVIGMYDTLTLQVSVYTILSDMTINNLFYCTKWFSENGGLRRTARRSLWRLSREVFVLYLGRLLSWRIRGGKKGGDTVRDGKIWFTCTLNVRIMFEKVMNTY
jgi:hypothetical protein